MKTSLLSIAQSSFRNKLFNWHPFLCLSSTLFIFHGLFASTGLDVASSMPPHTYTASIERVWTEPNQVQNGQKGVVVHVAFNADNSRGKECSVVAYFHYGNGQALRDQNGEYVSSVGTVSTIDRFTPPYEVSRYSDYPLFIPYAELHVQGTLQIMYYVMVRTGDGKSARSGNFYFNLTWNDKSNEEAGSLTCTVDCPKDGVPCSQFSIRLVGDDGGSTMRVSSSGRATFNDLAPGSYQAYISGGGDSKKGDDITAQVPRFSRPMQRVTIESGERSIIHFE